jgi:hypothetical protein
VLAKDLLPGKKKTESVLALGQHSHCCQQHFLKNPVDLLVCRRTAAEAATVVATATQ